MNAQPQELNDTRSELRRSLLGRDASGDDAAGFPRSNTMKVALDPRMRWVWLGGLTVLAVTVGRRLPVGRLSTLLATYTTLRRALHR
jgi:hypothetical protein